MSLRALRLPEHAPIAPVLAPVPAIRMQKPSVPRFPLSRTEQLAAMAAQIDAADAATDWGDEGDDDDDYATPSGATRSAAKQLIEELGRLALVDFGRQLPMPQLEPCADGGVDVHWISAKGRELLLGVRPNGDTVFSFYGDSTDGTTIKGSSRADVDNRYLVAWLLQTA